MGLQYTSTIKDFPLLYLEMKKTAILLTESKTADEILKLSVEDNIYQLDYEKRRRSMPLKMTKRLATLKMPLIKALANSTADEGKLIAFLALMKAERLVFEYMLDVYADKAENDELTNLDFMQFADRLSANSEKVAGWKTETLKDLNKRIKSILCDAGLAKRTKEVVTVQRPIVDSDLCRLLSDDDLAYAKAIIREDMRYGT